MSDDKSKPFDIRRDLLHLAQSILSENAHMKAEFNRLHLSNAGLTLDTTTAKEAYLYSTENVIEEAAKLYAFVSKR